MGIFKTNLQIINKFLKHFQPLFSKKQFVAFSFFIYAMFKEYRRYSIKALSDKSNLNYQKIQYFFSESSWSPEDINHSCLDIIQSQRTTASSPNGVMVIDDTGNPKPFAKYTEGVKYQYCGPLKREERCNVVVFSAFSSSSSTSGLPARLRRARMNSSGRRVVALLWKMKKILSTKPRRRSPAAASWAGSRDAWSGARARSATARSSAIRGAPT